MNHIFLTIIFSLILKHNMIFAIEKIDYFDVTKPKFEPLPVGIKMIPPNNINGLFIQSIFQSNIEQTLFFNVSEVKSLKKKQKFNFLLVLNVKNNNPLILNYEIFEKSIKLPIFSGSFSESKQNNLQQIGISLADIFVKYSLGFKGISSSKIAYTYQKKNGRKNINISSYDGTKQKRFSYNLGSNNYANWSEDNSQILYTTFTRSGVQLAIQSSKRLRASILSFPEGTQPQGGTWSKDSKSIILTLMKKGNSDIYKYNITDRNLEKIVTWKSLETSPDLSSDDGKMIFVSDSLRANQPQIYLFDKKNKRTKRITFRGKYNSSPKWSPNNSQIIYESKQKGFFQIFKYTFSTNRHTQLTFGRYNNEKPDWSPNGKQIVFSSNKEGIPKLFLITAYGGKMIRLTTNPNFVSETNPVWSK